MKPVVSIPLALFIATLAAPTQSLAQDVFEYRFAFGTYCG